MQIGAVAETRSVAGEAGALQPAAPMTREQQAELLTEVVRAPQDAKAQELWLPGVLLAVILACAAVCVIQHIRKEGQ